MHTPVATTYYMLEDADRAPSCQVDDLAPCWFYADVRSNLLTTPSGLMGLLDTAAMYDTLAWFWLLGCLSARDWPPHAARSCGVPVTHPSHAVITHMMSPKAVRSSAPLSDRDVPAKGLEQAG